MQTQLQRYHDARGGGFNKEDYNDGAQKSQQSTLVLHKKKDPRTYHHGEKDVGNIPITFAEIIAANNESLDENGNKIPFVIMTGRFGNRSRRKRMAKNFDRKSSHEKLNNRKLVKKKPRLGLIKYTGRMWYRVSKRIHLPTAMIRYAASLKELILRRKQQRHLSHL